MSINKDKDEIQFVDSYKYHVFTQVTHPADILCQNFLFRCWIDPMSGAGVGMTKAQDKHGSGSCEHVRAPHYTEI